MTNGSPGHSRVCRARQIAGASHAERTKPHSAQIPERPLGAELLSSEEDVCPQRRAPLSLHTCEPAARSLPALRVQVAAHTGEGGRGLDAAVVHILLHSPLLPAADPHRHDLHTGRRLDPAGWGKTHAHFSWKQVAKWAPGAGVPSPLEDAGNTDCERLPSEN